MNTDMPIIKLTPHGRKLRQRFRVPAAVADLYGKEFIHFSTDTQDRLAAQSECAAWLTLRWNEFRQLHDQHRRSLAREKVSNITPELIEVITQQVAHEVLSRDERIRNTPEAAEAIRQLTQGWRGDEFCIPVQPPAPLPPSPEQDGLTDDQLDALHLFNSYFAEQAGKSLASGRTSHAQATAQEAANKLGLDLSPASTKPEARGLYRAVAATLRQAWSDTVARDQGDFIETPPPPASAAPEPTGPSLSQIVEAFITGRENGTIKSPHGRSVPAMIRKYRTVLPMFAEVIGDKPLPDITPGDVAEYFNLIQRLPPRWADKRRTLKLSVRELAAREWPECIAEKTFEEPGCSSPSIIIGEGCHQGLFIKAESCIGASYQILLILAV